MLQLFKVLKIDDKLIFFSTSDSPYHRYAETSTPRLNDKNKNKNKNKNIYLSSNRHTTIFLRQRRQCYLDSDDL
jgi:hypothetical protein